MIGRLEIIMKTDATGLVAVVKGHRVGYLDDATVRCVLDVARNARYELAAINLDATVATVLGSHRRRRGVNRS